MNNTHLKIFNQAFLLLLNKYTAKTTCTDRRKQEVTAIQFMRIYQFICILQSVVDSNGQIRFKNIFSLSKDEKFLAATYGTLGDLPKVYCNLKLYLEIAQQLNLLTYSKHHIDISIFLTEQEDAVAAVAAVD